MRRRIGAGAHSVQLSLAIGRAMFGAVTILAPTKPMEILGVPPRVAASPPARFLAGYFGTRELALTLALLRARNNRRALRTALDLGLAADIGDALIAARSVARREGINPGAPLMLFSSLCGATAAFAARQSL